MRPFRSGHSQKRSFGVTPNTRNVHSLDADAWCNPDQTEREPGQDDLESDAESPFWNPASTNLPSQMPTNDVAIIAAIKGAYAKASGDSAPPRRTVSHAQERALRPNDDRSAV